MLPKLLAHTPHTRRAMKRGVSKKGAGFSLDVLQIQKEIAAGTFTEQDRRALDTILPGLFNVLKSRAAEAAREGKAKL